jgi:hypothetical protein
MSEQETRTPEIVFDGDDEAYLGWLCDHPDGYVLNTWRDPEPEFMVLHKATCGQITAFSNASSSGAFTERAYIKICAENIAHLEAWVKRHGRPDGSFSSICPACNPRR